MYYLNQKTGCKNVFFFSILGFLVLIFGKKTTWYLALVKVEYTLGSMHRQSLSFNYLVHALIRAQQCPCKRSLALKKPVGGLQPGQR